MNEKTENGLITNFNELLEEEVRTASGALIENGNIDGIRLSHDDGETNLEWKATLDKAFEIIADFADKHGIVID